MSARAALRERVAQLIERAAGGGSHEQERDALLEDLAAWQRAQTPELERLGGRATPTDLFRYARIAAHPPEADVAVFQTSGTTSGERGAHAFADLSIYDRAAEASAREALFPDEDRMPLVILAPRPSEAPDSSLSYMLGRFERWFATEARWFDSRAPIDPAALRQHLSALDAPVAILGTSFAFVHLEDALGAAPIELPTGSRLMTTGGTKGRSRAVEPDALRRALSERYRVPEAFVVSEYGMTELSSQLYETSLRRAVRGEPEGPRRHRAPAWVRVCAVDPETLAPRPHGERGVLRIDDAANLDSSCAIQTSDLATVYEGGELELHGRTPGAVPRGCSLAIEEALGS